MNIKALKISIIIISVIIVAYFSISCFVYLPKHPIWKIEGIPLFDKLKMVQDTTYIPFGYNMVNDIYFLQANKDIKFTVINEFGFIAGSFHHIYYKGNCIRTILVDDHQPSDTNIPLIHIISNENGHYWFIKATDTSGDSLLWCDAKYSDFSTLYPKYGVKEEEFEDKSLLIALDSAYTSGEWQPFMLLSEILLKHDKHKYASLVNRYASGSFSSSERQQNVKINITEDSVVAYAKKMKVKYYL